MSTFNLDYTQQMQAHAARSGGEHGDEWRCSEDYAHCQRQPPEWMVNGRSRAEITNPPGYVKELTPELVIRPTCIGSYCGLK